MPGGEILNTIIPVATAVGTQAMNAGFTAKSNRKTRRFNEAMWERQRDLDQQNWHMQNEYNLPKNQMARLKEAGLNPSLVYGNGATTTAQGVDSHAAAPYKDEAFQVDKGIIGDTIGDIQSMKTNPIQKSLLQQNLANAEKVEKLTEAQTLHTLAETDKVTQGNASGAIDLEVKKALHADGLVETNEREKFTINTYEREKRQEELHWQRKFNEMSKEQKRAEINRLEAELRKMGQEERIRELKAKMADQGINPDAGPATEYWQQLRKFLKIF